MKWWETNWQSVSHDIELHSLATCLPIVQKTLQQTTISNIPVQFSSAPNQQHHHHRHHHQPAESTPKNTTLWVRSYKVQRSTEYACSVCLFNLVARSFLTGLSLTVRLDGGCGACVEHELWVCSEFELWDTCGYKNVTHSDATIIPCSFVVVRTSLVINQK